MRNYTLVVLLTIGLVLMVCIQADQDANENPLLAVLRHRRDSGPVFVKRVVRSPFHSVNDAMPHNCCLNCRSSCTCCYA